MLIKTVERIAAFIQSLRVMPGYQPKAPDGEHVTPRNPPQGSGMPRRKCCDCPRAKSC